MIVDNTAPTVAVDIAASTLGGGSLTSTVTFTLSEASTDFTSGDVTAVGGMLSGFSGSGTSYTATFTANPGFTGTASVSVTAGSYHDAAGNAGAAGSDNVTVVSSSDPNDHDDDVPTGTPGYVLVTGDSNPNNLNDNIDTTSGATNDKVYAGAGSDTVSTGNAADIIYGQAGNDSLIGGNQDDVIYGGSGNDTIDGGNGNDTMWGGSGNDIITGGTNGSDLLIGGYGQDTLTGGTANDTFKYLSTVDSLPGTGDTIMDFTPNSDTIDFSEITGVTAVQGLVTSGTPILAHSIAWVQNGSETTVYVNSTGTAGAADMEIHLLGVTAASLQNTDFAVHP